MAGPGDDGRARPAERTVRRRALELLGLAARAGAIVTGTEAVRAAVRDNEIHRVILAEDAAPGQQGKLRPLLEARRVPFHSVFTRNELGAAIGRDAISAVGITDAGFARRTGELAGSISEDGLTVSPETSLRGTNDRGM